MKNKFGAFGARQISLETLVGGRPGTTIFQNPGGGEGGGAGGGRIQGPGPATPPWHNQFKTEKSKHPMLAMGPKDLNSAPYSPVHYSGHSMTSFQSSELIELPVVENS